MERHSVTSAEKELMTKTAVFLLLIIATPMFAASHPKKSQGKKNKAAPTAVVLVQTTQKEQQKKKRRSATHKPIIQSTPTQPIPQDAQSESIKVPHIWKKIAQAKEAIKQGELLEGDVSHARRLICLSYLLDKECPNLNLKEAAKDLQQTLRDYLGRKIRPLPWKKQEGHFGPRTSPLNTEAYPPLGSPKPSSSTSVPSATTSTTSKSVQLVPSAPTPPTIVADDELDGDLLGGEWIEIPMFTKVS